MSGDEADASTGAAVWQQWEAAAALLHGVADTAIYLLDADGVVQTWNAGAEELHGYRAEQMIGLPDSYLYTPEAVAAGAPERHLAEAVDSEGLREEAWRVRPDGSRWLAVVNTTPLRDDARLAGFARVVFDDSARRRAFEEQHRRELIEARERIGDELHGHVVNALFTIGLSLAGARSLAQRPELVQRLDQSIHELDSVISHIRNTVWTQRVEAPPAPDDAASRSGRPEGFSPGLRIVVVDDDYGVRLLLARLLSDLGRVETAGDATEAMAHIVSGPVDVLVVDLLLPGTSGAALLHRLKDQGNVPPAVIITGMDTDDPLVRMAKEVDGTVLLPKPFDNSTLRDAVLTAARSRS